MSNRAYCIHGILGLIGSLICPVLIWLPAAFGWLGKFNPGSILLTVLFSYLCVVVTLIHGLIMAYFLKKEHPEHPAIYLLRAEYIMGILSIVAGVLAIINFIFFWNING